MMKLKLSAALVAATMLLSACGTTPPASSATTQPSSTPPASNAPADGSMKDGTYEGVATGFGGDITLDVIVKDGKISAVTVKSHSETADVSDAAMKGVPEAIVTKNSAEVDVVTGATVSSKAIMAAAQVAINTAKGISAAPQVILENPDVLVVGGGMSGMRAAIEAAANGAKVILFEKTGALGGTFGGSTLSGTGTKMQKENGITNDTPESFFNDFVRLNEGYRKLNPGVEYSWNEDLGHYYAENSGRVVDWLDEHGADMGDRKPSQPTLYEPLSIPRVYSGKRTSYHDVLIKELQQYLDNGTVSVVLNTPVTELTTEGTAVTGVKTKNKDGVEAEYKAKATILATGGYGYSEELVKRYNFQNFTTTTPAFTTGDGHLMAEKVGAQLRNMDFLTAYAGGLKTPEDGLKKNLSIRVKDFPHIIFVNKEGNRFVDELGPEDGSSYDEITSWWKKGDNKIYIMLDQAMVDDLKAAGKPIISGDKDWSKFDEQLTKGNILWGGSTIEEAANKAGIDGAALTKTIERYNGFAKTGKDTDFGRTRLMTEFTGGTYYIFESTPYIMITAGGPDMSDKGEVLDAKRAPIPGLYQAGEMIGMANAFGRTTIGGVGNTGALVWGELAGRSASAYALAK